MTKELSCNCILQKVSFRVWEKHSWLHDFFTFNTPDYDYPITIHAENLTDLDSKIEVIRKELEIKHPNCSVRDFAL